MIAEQWPLHMPEQVAEMPAPERLFLWATRAWSAYHNDLSGIWWYLDRAFAQEGIHTALPPFHQMMSSLYGGLKRWPDIRCVACPQLGNEEVSLLRVLAHMQQEASDRAYAELREWVMPATAREICLHASHCTAILAARQMRFSISRNTNDKPCVITKANLKTSNQSA